MASNLQDDGWELESAAARHERNPTTFEIPEEEERRAVQVGDQVKLLFLLSAADDQGEFVQCERMWITVSQRRQSDYVGTLNSLPRTSAVLSPGDAITFGPEHIAAIYIPESHER